jgi:uncharacterized protein YegL
MSFLIPESLVQVIPFYVVVDESASMAGAPLDAANEALKDLHEEIAQQPALADRARFSVVGFSNDAEEVLKLSDLSTISQIPALHPQGETNYSAAFDFLRPLIESDYQQLRQSGHTVYRPVMFFISDGQPTDADWQKSLAVLRDSSWPRNPHILAFGLGDAKPDIIGTIASSDGFGMCQSDPDARPVALLRGVISNITKTIVHTTRTLSSGQAPSMEIAEPPTGMSVVRTVPLTTV